jgi:Amt family ammonium transporter
MTLSDSGSVAWVLISSVVTFLMVPGVGLFYSSLTHKKSLLSTIGFSYLIFSISTLTWGLLGFSLAFGKETLAKGFIGDCTYCGLREISFSLTNPFSNNISFSAFFLQEMIKAGISSVILTIPFMGKLRPIFLILMTISHQLIIYSPITYWLKNQDGWLNTMGAIDFSGGTMVFLSSGFAILGMLYMIG